MNLYTPLAAVAALVGGIICLRIFWTLWTRVDRKIAGDKLNVDTEIRISELKDARVHVRFKSGSNLENVILIGYCSTHYEAPYELKQLLILKSPVGKTYYVRISEIEYFEQVMAPHE